LAVSGSKYDPVLAVVDYESQFGCGDLMVVQGDCRHTPEEIKAEMDRVMESPDIIWDEWPIYYINGWFISLADLWCD